MIISVSRSLDHASFAKIRVYPASIVIEMPIPEWFFGLPPHRMALAVAEYDGHVSQMLGECLENGREVRMNVQIDREAAPAEQQVDAAAYRIAEGRTSAEDIEGELRAVYEAHHEYSDPAHGGGHFAAMVSRFAEDPFYKLHCVAAEYLNLTAPPRLSGGPS